MLVTKVHRALKFRQLYWLMPYMQLNTERKEFRNKFEESFFKLMNNSCYEKTLESKRDRLTLQLVTSREHLSRRNDTPFICCFKIFNENLAAVSSRNRSILWNKPTIVGAVVGFGKISHVRLSLQCDEETLKLLCAMLRYRFTVIRDQTH